MRSESWQKRTFQIVLFSTLIFHAAFMVTKFKGDSTVKNWAAPQPIKIKLVQEAFKGMVAPQNKRQIVQSEDSASKEKPKDPAFLSDKDRSFDRETRARNVDVFKDTALGNAAINQKAQEKKAGETKKKTDFKDLKLSDFGMHARETMPKDVARSPASESKQGIQSGNPNSPGFSSTNDYIEEVALGDFTHLNTVEYKFYGFFHRIRQKLEQFWGKSIKEKSDVLFRAGRRLPASESLTTALQVTLNEKGEIISVKILGASGVKELDDAAIESFNEAGPFPNPPKELLVNGKATIEWGFVVKS